MEQIVRLGSIEQARNAAIRWLEERGATFGPHRKIAVGRLGVLEGAEVGTSASQRPFWRIRLDYDPEKFAHFNVEFGRGPGREKTTFCFPGSEQLIEKLARKRAPR